MANNVLLSFLCVASLACSAYAQDEIAILKKRMDRQTLAVTTLEQRLIQSQSATSKLLGEVNQQLTALSNNVAFFVRLDTSYKNIDVFQTIVFKTAVTNNGAAYNRNTGEFKAPVSGTYVFYSNILEKARRSIETTLQVNAVNKLYLYSGSNMAVLDLKSGDKVKLVKQGVLGKISFDIHANWSTFSGFLLKPSL